MQPLDGPPGYQFVGWFTEELGGTQVTVIPSGTSEDITLYAHWAIIIPWRVLIFEPNDASGPPAENIPSPIQIPDASEVWIPDDMPVRTGYTFVGWNIYADGSGVMYQPGQYLGRFDNGCGSICNLAAEFIIRLLLLQVLLQEGKSPLICKCLETAALAAVSNKSF